MTITHVIRSSGVMVPPSESTPSGTLDFSVMDALPIVQMDVHSIHVFRHGQEPTKLIREAVSKALVPYYPLAGRLNRLSDGSLQVNCTGEGAWFIEASADYSLESVNYFDDILLVPHDDLLPTSPPESDGLDPLVRIQLTYFTCGGYVIAQSNPHSLLDGIGAAQWLSTVGEFARGFQKSTIAPVWNREAIPTTAGVIREPGVSPPPPSMPLSFELLEPASIDISQEHINKLKNEFAELTGDYCSTFDVVVASLWRHRTQAIELEKETEVNLMFGVNTRQFLEPPMPEGYYGNCFYPVKVTISSGWLVEASHAEVVKLIKDAKARVPTEFRKWLKGDELEASDDPFSFPLAYTTLCISAWNGLGFNTVDHGWGHPVHIFPIQKDLSIMPVGALGLPPSPNKGIRVMTCCVNKKHLPSLVDYFK
ncbi:hypothetical protein AQUCO_01100457v1 [Aquilegia coerulea]|uniref:Uncharacterized protein n=1 Tax=Aquilegia coerulea TaxID=218851 RepID=A0A2G5E791_AQUCA|nr:hypothetical protein AQUCO_01100457v1 [Aquilegia coerulea]